MNKNKCLCEFILSGNDKKVIKEMNVGASIVYKKDKDGIFSILLIRRSSEDHWPDAWEFPRGKCDKGQNEKIRDCTIREIKEETDLDIEIVELIDSFQYLADRETRKTTSWNYLCKMKDPNQEVKLSKEHSAFKWIRTSGEADNLVFQEQRITIIKALNILNGEQHSSIPMNDFTLNKILEGYISVFLELYKKSKNI